jgi:hypothetical protein
VATILLMYWLNNVLIFLLRYLFMTLMYECIYVCMYLFLHLYVYVCIYFLIFGTGDWTLGPNLRHYTSEEWLPSCPSIDWWWNYFFMCSFIYLLCLHVLIYKLHMNICVCMYLFINFSGMEIELRPKFEALYISWVTSILLLIDGWIDFSGMYLFI